MTARVTENQHGKPTYDATVILLAHGSERHPAANAHLLSLTEATAARHSFADLRLGCLQGAPYLADVFQSATREDVIALPLLMSDGKLAEQLLARARTELPDARRFITTSPLGLHSRIPEIAADRGVAALQAAGVRPETAYLILVAHGARNDGRNRETAMQHAESIVASRRFADVRLALIEERPSVADVLADVDRPSAVVGLFAAPGGHAIEDVGRAIAASGRADIVDAGPVGLDARIPDLIGDIARRALEGGVSA